MFETNDRFMMMAVVCVRVTLMLIEMNDKAIKPRQSVSVVESGWCDDEFIYEWCDNLILEEKQIFASCAKCILNVKMWAMSTLKYKSNFHFFQCQNEEKNMKNSLFLAYTLRLKSQKHIQMQIDVKCISFLMVSRCELCDGSVLYE